MIRRLACLLLASAAPAWAQGDLPPEPVAREVLDAHPSVTAAKARIDGARADQRVLTVGPHEYNLTAGYIRRRADRDGVFDEFDATLSRGIRLPGKAALDRKAGALGVAAAENMAEDVRHQAALLLNELWWDWLSACAEAAIDAQGVSNYEATLAAVRRRVALKEAAQLEADQAAAALGDARVAAVQSRGQADYARARLAAQFPTLPLDGGAPEVSRPELSEDALETMSQQVIERSHEIAAADAVAARQSALAARARLDRIADPSIGVRMFSERDGAERGAGVVLSIPLGTGARAGVAAKHEAEAHAAASDLTAVRLDVTEMATGDVARARAAHSAWRSAREALDAQLAALQKLRRGNQLGEIDLADLLQAERLTHAAFRAEVRARADANRAINKLRIDSHNLWAPD